MKVFAIVVAAVFVAGCSGMQPSSSSGSSGTSGASGTGSNSSEYHYWQFNGTSGVNRHDNERDLYFGG
jgi:heat shock protein HslJ